MAAFVASAGSFGLSITTTPSPSSPSPDPHTETGSRASLAYATSVVSSTVAISSSMRSHSQVLSACKCLSSSASGALNAPKALLGSTSTCGYGRGGCAKIVARAGGSSAKHPEITSQPPSEVDSARDRLAINKEKTVDTVMILGEDEKLDQEKDKDEAKSDEYSSTMTHAMGAVLTYRHELGMNYNFVLPDLIVGSCLQTPSDVDRLKNIGVKTIFCLQQDPDLEYFGVDINAIQEHAKGIGGIEHIRAQIRDFDPFDLRKQLPSVVAILYEASKRNKGITYIHCTAGLGRAPAVALTYMYWLLGYELLEANELLLSVRPCFPKLESIRNATCDLLTGGSRETIHLKWPAKDCETVEISGLDVGWGQMLPLTFIPMKNYWMLSRELLVGKYEYKYIVDGIWTTNPHEPLTQPNKDGHVNNFVEVVGESDDKETKGLRQRLMQDSPILDEIDRQIIRRKLMSLVSC